ncbi:MAG: hydroxymethylbilane synthase [Acidobacteriota bacterium]
MNQPPLVIGSRGSKLALYQSNWVKSELEKQHPGLQVEIRIIKTSGDLFTEAPLSKIGGKGLFTKEIEEALIRTDIDLAVHSLKDLPTVLPEGLCLGAVSRREDVRDALISNRYQTLEALPAKARVGTSSLRRQSQLLHLRGDLQIENLRGNLDTRLRKLDQGEYDAILLACAGLVRLGLGGRITERVPVERICPAVGQGALGLECRSDDTLTRKRLESLNHLETRQAVDAERSFLRRLGGGCQVPIAAHAAVQNSCLRMSGVVASTDGRRLFRDEAESPTSDPEELGVVLAEKLLSAGADEVIAGLS